MTNIYLCPSCDYFIEGDLDAKYCEKCGATLIQSCPNCDKPILLIAAIRCRYCGSEYRKPKA
jgi:primosomal protein N'